MVGERTKWLATGVLKLVSRWIFPVSFKLLEVACLALKAAFVWEGLIIQWLSRIQYSQPADVLWNLTVWSVMQNSSVPAPAFCRMALVLTALLLLLVFRKGAVGSHGLYLGNPTWLQSAEPCRTSLFMVICRGWSQSWMHLLAKGHYSVSYRSPVTSGSHKYLRAANINTEGSQVWSRRHENCLQSYLCPRVFHV